MKKKHYPLPIKLYCFVRVEINITDSDFPLNSYDEKVASKKILDNMGLKGYQVTVPRVSLLNGTNCISNSAAIEYGSMMEEL